MAVNSYDAVAEKVFCDMESAIKKDPFINEFYIIPTLEEENKNSSPVLKGENTLGLESWIIAHIYPYAHHQILQKNNYKIQNLCKLLPCLTGVALLNPEMPTVWNKRRELIISKKLSADDELRLTRMALTRKPKCNDALTHRKWIIMEVLKNVHEKSALLHEELKLSEMIANRYHSNYHAWSHRMWSLQHLLPDNSYVIPKKRQKSHFFETVQTEPPEVIFEAITISELAYLTNSEISQVYFEELENNFKWVSSHVSDHSGLHFRKFLLSEIMSFMRDYLGHSCIRDFASGYFNSKAHNPVSLVFTEGKLNFIEFLKSYKFSDTYLKLIDDYIGKLETEVTLLDIGLFLIVTELKSNYSLCSLFSNHEALWCYRRYLVYCYKKVISALVHCKNKLSQQIFVHQDKNGIPCRKDFKYDDTNKSDAELNNSSLYVALYSRLLSYEEELITKVSVADEFVGSLTKNYSHWLKHC